MPIYEFVKDQNPDLRLIIVNEWEEVNMGDLDGKTPKTIQELFADHFPGIAIPKDFNDCMNTQWPAIDGKQYIFESYDAFDVRIKKITAETLQNFSGKTIGLCTHTENIRNLVMDSVGERNFFETEFGKSVRAKLEIKRGEKIDDVELFQKTLGQLGLVRADFKPNDTASINLSADIDRILRLHSTTNFVIR
jgi:broad specificity phosphatase PhoE